MKQERLIFIIGAPRSGTTLLQRMLGSHSQIYTHPEPHLLTPLAYLGYYDTVERAPFDHVNAAQAFKEFAQELPRGEADYLDALRAYANTLYGRVLAPSGRAYFLDKTPAYALVLPFIARLYPQAHYLVITRHPLAIRHSVAHSFFAGDYQAADVANPILRRYVPAIADFLRRPTAAAPARVHVRYEDLVAEPAVQMRRLLGHIGLPFEAQTLEYGRQQHIAKSYGDPVGVKKHLRPVTDSVATWAQDLRSQPAARALAGEQVAALADADLVAWGYPRAHLLAALEAEGTPARPTRRPRLDAYQVKRRLLLQLRRHSQGRRVRQLVRQLRHVCDLLLRD